MEKSKITESDFSEYSEYWSFGEKRISESWRRMGISYEQSTRNIPKVLYDADKERKGASPELDSPILEEYEKHLRESYSEEESTKQEKRGEGPDTGGGDFLSRHAPVLDINISGKGNPFVQFNNPEIFPIVQCTEGGQDLYDLYSFTHSKCTREFHKGLSSNPQFPDNLSRVSGEYLWNIPEEFKYQLLKCSSFRATLPYYSKIYNPIFSSCKLGEKELEVLEELGKRSKRTNYQKHGQKQGLEDVDIIDDKINSKINSNINSKIYLVQEKKKRTAAEKRNHKFGCLLELISLCAIILNIPGIPREYGLESIVKRSRDSREIKSKIVILCSNFLNTKCTIDKYIRENKGGDMGTIHKLLSPHDNYVLDQCIYSILTTKPRDRRESLKLSGSNKRTLLEAQRRRKQCFLELELVKILLIYWVRIEVE